MTIEELFGLLMTDNPSQLIINNEEEIFKLIPELSKCKGFNQNNPWHPYDVYDHTLHVLDNTPNNLVLRITALFHDIGKPNTYTEDKNGIGHFYNHWEESRRIFIEFAKKYNLDSHVCLLIANLIYYHDINIGKMNEFDKMKLLSIFGDEGIMMLFDFKRADLLAQSTEFHYLLDDFRKQRNDILGLERHMKYE